MSNYKIVWIPLSDKIQGQYGSCGVYRKFCLSDVVYFLGAVSCVIIPVLFAHFSTGLVSWVSACIDVAIKGLLIWEMAERAFSWQWTYFEIKHRQVLLGDFQVPPAQWVSCIFEVSALPRDFAEFDTLILQRRNVGTSRRKCGGKSKREENL